jgi:AmmeMemoRadiSam system protein A
MSVRSCYVDFAWKVIRNYIKDNLIIDIPKDLPEEMNKKAGCFVTIHKLNGDLRGCIGTILPVYPALAEEIRSNAISSATRDPRFSPLKTWELDEIFITVDILSEPEKTSYGGLNPKKYGIIVEAGWRKGVLLPDLEGVDTPETQLRIVLRKAGIDAGEKYELYRFTSTRCH